MKTAVFDGISGMSDADTAVRRWIGTFPVRQQQHGIDRSSVAGCLRRTCLRIRWKDLQLPLRVTARKVRRSSCSGPIPRNLSWYFLFCILYSFPFHFELERSTWIWHLIQHMINEFTTICIQEYYYLLYFELNQLASSHVIIFVCYSTRISLILWYLKMGH